MGRGVPGMIGHTQPRRIAARTLAARVAAELGGEVGHSVGYKVRFNDRTGPNAHIKLMTDGILLAETQADRWLDDYDTLIIDEAHERNLNVDLLLGYLKDLLPKRPELKLICTSATIDPHRFAAHFDDAPIVEVSGRTYPVEVRYRPLQSDSDDQADRDLLQGITDAVDEVSREDRGDILVFLPGEREIRECAETLRKQQRPDTDILPLYSRLGTSQQNKVFQAHKRRHIVLATNVAETSLTVPGIRYVIDPGLARINRYNPRTKVQRLPIEPISMALGRATHGALRAGQRRSVYTPLFTAGLRTQGSVYRARDPPHQPGHGDPAPQRVTLRPSRRLPVYRPAQTTLYQRRLPAVTRTRRPGCATQTHRYRAPVGAPTHRPAHRTHVVGRGRRTVPQRGVDHRRGVERARPTRTPHRVG